ncbi:uncharacterized protein METZ01_LOCUS212056, partial [marine metagenome]
CNLYPHLYPLKIALGELIFYIINSISPKSDTFPSCERVVVFSCGQCHEYYD